MSTPIVYIEWTYIHDGVIEDPMDPPQSLEELAHGWRFADRTTGERFLDALGAIGQVLYGYLES